MSEQPTEPYYGEETDQDPTYGPGKTEESGAETEGNPDLHGAAREVAETATGDDPSETPGGG